MVLPACASNRGAWQGGQFGRDSGGDRIGEACIVSDQDGLGGFVVFRLGEQVYRDAARIVGGIGQDDDFGRTGDGVDADAAEHLPFGFRDIGVAGTDDAIDRRNAVGAVGQCRYRLGAADPIDLRHAGAMCGGKHQWVQHAVRGGHAHGDARVRLRRGLGSRSSAQRMGRPPCRPARTARRRPAGSSACRE